MRWHDTRGTRKRINSRRRAITTGVIGMGLLTGCLGDDDDVDDGDVDDVPADDADDDADDVDDIDIDDDDDGVNVDDGDDVDDADLDDDGEHEVHDVTAIHHVRPPLAADAQYNVWGAEAGPFPDLWNVKNYWLIERSLIDHEMYGQLVTDWSYSPGFIELNLRDDVYWWSGDQFQAGDVRTHYELEDWVFGGEDFDAHANIITYEQMDDFVIRFALADTWREEWAIQSTFVGITLNSSRTWNEGWLEQFEDTGGDLDAVEEVREALAEHAITDDEELVHTTHTPFEFRLDGSIGEVTEDAHVYELVPEKNGNERAFVDSINYRWYREIASEERNMRKADAFFDEEEPYTGWGGITPVTDLDDPDIPFDFWDARWVDAAGGTGAPWNFNVSVHPTGNPNFRRAWCFMTDSQLWEADRPQRMFEDHATAFVLDSWVESIVSDDVVEAFTDYQKASVEWDRAEEEMEIGGFERNADGMYLNQETGEPIEVTVSSWIGDVFEYGTDFFADIDEFGIGVDQTPDYLGEDEFEINSSWHGGMMPEFVFETIFGEDTPWWTNPNQFPETVLAPPVGETDADEDDWIEYETRAMTDRLGVTTDEERYQEMVDQLAWISNQLIPRYQYIVHVSMGFFNDNRWRFEQPEDAPGKWVDPWPVSEIYENGVLSYVPEDER